jgi:hypothetical protein
MIFLVAGFVLLVIAARTATVAHNSEKGGKTNKKSRPT